MKVTLILQPLSMNLELVCSLTLLPSTFPDQTFPAGITVDASVVQQAVSEYVSLNIAHISIKGWNEAGPTIAKVKALPALRWATSADLKLSVDNDFEQRFGSKEAAKKLLDEQRAAALAAKVFKVRRDPVPDFALQAADFIISEGAKPQRSGRKCS